MKIYRIKVNGKVYEVEVESVSEKEGEIEVKKEEAEVAPKSQGSLQSIVAPMAGVIADIKVKVGDRVRKNQVVAVLEAMKLENEIISAVDGTVKEILVARGKEVSAKQVLITVG